MTIADFLGPDDAAEFTRDLLIGISESTPDFIFAKDIDSRLIFANTAVLRAIGRTWAEVRGKSDLEWHFDAEEARAIVAADARIMAGETVESLEEVLTTPDGPQVYLSTKWPLRARDGRVIGLYGISMNITERKNSERLRQLLADELDHRVRNTLALVQVMARQTLRTAGIDKAMWDAFEGRLQAMAKAHNLLTRDKWEGDEVRRVVAKALEVHGRDHVRRFDVDGPEVWIDAQNALALAMALHELGTNALKYGALSVPAGRVAIDWAIDPAAQPAMFELNWRESGGPPVSPPARRGFGSRLIETAFGRHGAPQIDYAPTGLLFMARLPLGVRSVAA